MANLSLEGTRSRRSTSDQGRSDVALDGARIAIDAFRVPLSSFPAVFGPPARHAAAPHSMRWRRIRFEREGRLPSMTVTAIVTGTGLRNADGSSRARVIRRHCEVGGEVVLRKALAVGNTSSVPPWRCSSRFPGSFDTSDLVLRNRGSRRPGRCCNSCARLDSGGEVRARVKSVYAPEEKDSPRVSLIIE